jgi:hypothetical protein
MFGMPLQRLLSLTLASICAVSMAQVKAQDSLYFPSEPAAVFSAGAEYLAMTRDTELSLPGSFIAGPDSAALTFNDADFGYTSGVRAFLAFHGDGVRVEGIYSNFGAWDYSRTGQLTQGLAFDEGTTGAWNTNNFIDLTTGFESLHGAASGAMGGDAEEEEGLGPVGGFADALPRYEVYYRSLMQTFEVNLVTEDPESRAQFGIGYRNLNLDELAGASIQGSLRAIDTGVANGGLSHASLITFGGLTHLGGVADGFEDETRNASTLPDTLQMFHDARTTNDLNGAQAIFQEEIMYWRGWTIDGIAKAGLYHNHVKGTISERYTGTDPGAGGDSSTYGRVFSDSKSQLAFAGSLGLRSDFPLSDHWSFVSGYEMMFIYGLALSPEQYAGVTGPFATRTYAVDSHGQMIAHGGNFGLQFTY